jgi:molybdate transport system ATP-binding protein
VLSIHASKRLGDFRLHVAIDVVTPGVVALFGRSGCGKTTLSNLIAGLLRPDSARIEVDGICLEDTRTGHSVPAEQRRIGYVFQDARLFPHRSVLGNLRYGERRAPAGTRRIAFDRVVELLGVQSLLDRRVKDLSGGERQRVALGRALLSQPRLLLLDEPLASLDVARREEVLPYLEKLHEEFALPIIYVSHQFDEVLRLASHVVLLENGNVVSQGALEAVSLHPKLRAIVGPDAVGAVVTGSIVGTDSQTGLTSVAVGSGTLKVNLEKAVVGERVRIQLLARDVILATQPVEGLSVRNMLAGTITNIVADDADTDMVHVDIGGGQVLARVTRGAMISLALRTGMPIWVLIKAVSIRGHAFLAPPAVASTS